MAAVYKTLSKGSKNDDHEEKAPGAKENKQRVLIISSRGVSYRHRHLINDITSMLPHGRKESKFDTKSKPYLLCELAEMNNCNNVMYFETRKGRDLYIWLSKVPNGPTVKLHLENAHTSGELNFTGNCLKGSRPILSFDSTFDTEPFLQLVKELFLQMFGVPPKAKKSKPFIDHVLSFSVADGRIWVRNYQIKEVEPEEKTSTTSRAETDISLDEIGPRFCMMPIFCQEGSFGGPIIYQNKRFVSPNQVRASLRRTKTSKHISRAEQQAEKLARKVERGGVAGAGGGGKAKAVEEALEARALFA